MSRTLSVPLGVALLAIALFALPSCDNGGGGGGGGGTQVCSINVTSTPGGASITLDGVATGHTTPHLFSDVVAGTHTVRVSLAGYACDEPQRQRIVTAGETWNVSFTFRNLNQPPTVSNLSVTPASVRFTGGTVTIACQAADDRQVAAVGATISTGGAPVTRALTQSGGQWRCTWDAPANTTAQARNYGVQVVATDSDGATSAAVSASFTVEAASSPPALPW
ncbi:MAG: PEGA domain-containing protein [Armatimonadota bacterium]